MNSDFVIKDKLREWEASNPERLVFDPYFLKFLIADKYENNFCILEKDTYRPHLTNTELTKKIIFDYNGDLFVDIEQ